MDIRIRAATSHDAAELAPMLNEAGSGLPLVTWRGMAGPDGDPWEVARERIRGTEGAVSHRNIWVAELHGETAGTLVAYHQPDEARAISEDIPPVFRPLVELEAEAAGTGYVNLLATIAAHRGRGIGSRLLEFAESRFRGPRGMSLIVSDVNTGAMRLYERHGYRQVSARAKVAHDDWQMEGRDWLLMVKQ